MTVHSFGGLRSKQSLGEARTLFTRFDLKKMPVLEGHPPMPQDVPYSNMIKPRTPVQLRASFRPHNGDVLFHTPLYKVVGIIDRSTAEKAVSHGLKDATVEEYMEMDFVTLKASDSLFDAVGKESFTHVFSRSN